MARCGCSGSSCGCLLVAGEGISVTGVGSAGNPFVITADALVDISDYIQSANTATVTMSLLGAGTTLDPFIVSAVTTVSTADLTDLTDPGGPADGDTLIWVGGGGGHFEYGPATASNASISATDGLLGDGTLVDPLHVSISGVWGAGQLAGQGLDDLVGAAIYVDSDGALRATPTGLLPVETFAYPPHKDGLTILDTLTGAAMMSYEGAWVTFATGNLDIDLSMTPIPAEDASGVYAIDPAYIQSQATIRLNLTANTDLSLPNGAAGKAYTVYFDVIPNTFTLGIDGGGTFAAVASAAQVVIPLFWTGVTWFSQWAEE